MSTILGPMSIGESTNHHDHVIYPVSFIVTKIVRTVHVTDILIDVFCDDAINKIKKSSPFYVVCIYDHTLRGGR